MSRPLRFVPHLLLVLALAAGLAFALATRYPQAEVLARAEAWPGVGPWVARFRAAYLPPPAPAAGAAPAPPAAPPAPAAPEVEVLRVIDPEMVGVKPKVWARPGTIIYAESDLDSRRLARVEHLFPLSRLERRGDWFRVRYGSRLAGFSKGWVHLPGYREPTPEELAAPAPVLPLAPVPIAAEALAAARRHLEAPATESACGDYRLLTDVRNAELLAMCRRVGAAIESAYRRRYGLEPVGETSETIMLFARDAAFRAFREEIAAGLAGDAFAAPARGLVAVPVEDRLPAAVEASLVHELAHLLNRRALGPALPPWLDEGLARDLDTAGVAAAAASPPLAGARPVTALELLIQIDHADFQRRAEENYRAAGRWIGYLVAGPDADLAAGMKSFLAAVAGGTPISAALLLESLGRDWPELERAFRDWEAGVSELAAD